MLEGVSSAGVNTLFVGRLGANLCIVIDIMGHRNVFENRDEMLCVILASAKFSSCEIQTCGHLDSINATISRDLMTKTFVDRSHQFLDFPAK